LIEIEAHAMSDKRSLIRNPRFILPLLADLALGFAYNIFIIAFMIAVTRKGQVADLAAGIFVAAQTGYVIALLFGGYFASKYGYKKVILASLALYALVPIAIFYSMENRADLYALGLLSGVCAGLSSPAASVQMYSVVPKDDLRKVFFPIYFLSALSIGGYFLGHKMYVMNQLLPYVSASIIMVGCALLYAFVPAAKDRPEQERDLTVDKLIPLLHDYVNARFITLIALICLMSVGSTLFFFGCGFRLLREKSAGQDMAIVMAATLLIAVLAPKLLGRAAKGLVPNLICIPVAAMAALLFYETKWAAMSIWVLFGACSLMVNRWIFSRMYDFLDVESGIHTSLYQLATAFGALLSYGMIYWLTRAGDAVKYAFLVYAVLMSALLAWLLWRGYLKEPAEEKELSPAEGMAT
jgi:MFS family permease